MLNELVKQGSSQWHELRKNRITGSRVPGILGLSPYLKADDVMREMVRQALGEPTEFTGNVATDWGREHEAEAVFFYERETFQKVNEVGIVIDDQYDWLAFSPDGIVDDDLFVEVKCPYGKGFLSIDGRPDYQAQINLGLKILKKKSCDFIIYYPEHHPSSNGDRRMIVDSVKFDGSKWLESVFEKLKSFYDQYQLILNSKTLQKQYLEPLIFETNDNEWLRVADEYVKISKDLSEKEAALSCLKSRLIELAGDRSTRGCGILLSKISKQGNVNYKKVIADLNVNVDIDKYRSDSTNYWAVKQSI